MKKIVAVSNSAELKAFIDFPHDLYKDDSNYVPELFIAQRDLLTPGKHPFFKHSSLQLFLLFENNKVIGRIAAILNNNHNSFNQKNDGFFGFFDCINDQIAADLLFNEASAWLRAKKVSTIIGPVNFSTNETCGLLIEGFEYAPYAMMTYNAPYYSQLIENFGFVKQTDLLAYEFKKYTYNERALKMKEILQERLSRKGIVIRPLNLKNFKQEVENLRAIYNQAWDKNLGFVPMTKDEFEYMAKDLKLIIDPKFCLIAEDNGKTVGFGLAVPNINRILQKIKRGRLLPTGIFKLLLGKSKIDSVRIIALGVIEDYRKMGIEACFYGAMMQRFTERNMVHAEASWILENNTLMKQGLENMGTKVYKRYRIYEKTL